MLTVHHLNNSRSQRILWLLEELGISYEIRKYSRDKQTLLAPPELRDIHPLGKAPVVTDGPVTVAESGAIIEYLVSTYGDGALRPAEGTPQRLSYNYWLHYAEGSFMPLMFMALVMSRIEQAPLLVRPIARAIAGRFRAAYLTPNITRNLEFIEDTLSKSTWFCGPELSAADIQMSFPLEAAEARIGLGEQYPLCAAFLRRMRERPAYKAALEAGGHFELSRA